MKAQKHRSFISVFFLALLLFVVLLTGCSKDSGELEIDLDGELDKNPEPTVMLMTSLAPQVSVSGSTSNYKFGLIDPAGNVLVDTVHTSYYEIPTGHFIFVDEQDALSLYDSQGVKLQDYADFFSEQESAGNTITVDIMLGGLLIESEEGMILYDFHLNPITKEYFDNIDVSDRESAYFEGIYNYYIVEKDGKKGAIDPSTGDYLVSPFYDEVEDLFISDYVNEGQKKSDRTFFIAVCSDSSWGLYDRNGKEVLEPLYDKITGGTSMISYWQNGKVGILDSEGTLVTEAKYDDCLYSYYGGCYAVKRDGFWGLIDKKDRIAKEFEYSEMRYMPIGNFIAKKDNLEIALDRNGKELFDSSHSNHWSIEDDYRIVVEKGKFGVIDSNGNVTIPATYKNITKIAGNYFSATNSSDNLFIIDKDGDLFYEFKPGSLTSSGWPYKINNCDGSILRVHDPDSGYGLILFQNDKAQWFLPCEYEKIDMFGYSGTVGVEIIIALDKDQNLYCMDSSLETVLLGQYEDFKTQSDTIHLDGDGVFTLFTVKKDGKYGAIDNLGHTVIDFIYDDMGVFNEYGYVAVKKDGLWGSADYLGNVIAEPIYELLEDGMAPMEFIGEWYMAVWYYDYWLYSKEPVEAVLYSEEIIKSREL